MADNLANAGHEVIAWNRTRDKAEDFASDHASARVADTPAEAAQTASIVITMLADDEAVRACWLGEGEGRGLLQGAASGTLAIDMGTTSPALSRELHARGAERNVHVLDVPVSGSTEAAKNGTLTLIAGGPVTAVERVRPVLQALGPKLIHVGPTGAGSCMKLAVNSVIHSLNQAVGEALVLAERSGIPRQSAYAVLEASAVAAPMLGYRKRQYLDPDESPVSFTVSLAKKDVELALELAASVEAPMPQARINLEILQDAVRHGYGGSDMAAVVRYLAADKSTKS